jgi:hypothetical protein
MALQPPSEPAYLPDIVVILGAEIMLVENTGSYSNTLPSIPQIQRTLWSSSPGFWI